MSLLGNILKKLGFGPDVAKAVTAPKSSPPKAAAPPPARSSPKPSRPTSGPYPPAEKLTPADRSVRAAIPVVDVVAKLEGLAAKNPQKLNWKISIVDLLKLLDLDSSLEARKELATELHAPADVMGDSARMNTWLHKAVLRTLADNGGNVPKELLD